MMQKAAVSAGKIGLYFILMGLLAVEVVSGNDFATGWRPVVLEGREMMTGGSFGFEGSVVGPIRPALGIVMMLMFGARNRA